jgi:hypothetical protein
MNNSSSSGFGTYYGFLEYNDKQINKYIHTRFFRRTPLDTVKLDITL